MSEQTKYTVVDLFAGAGGLSCGFLQTGRFSVKAAFENNPNAQKTYKENHSSTMMYNDVEMALNDEIKETLGEIDVVIGGPPCQGFSSVNRQKNHAVSQNNSLMKKFVKAVLHLNPSAFIMENVSMLQSNVHLFYVSEDDENDINDYGIKTMPAKICLLDEDYIFEGAEAIVANQTYVIQYLWEENEYFILNVLHKNRNNKEKLISTLIKYKKKLIALADRLSTEPITSPISEANVRAGLALRQCFPDGYDEPFADNICAEIQSAVMIQRMLGKAKEIFDNKILVDKYTFENGLMAHVTSMAVIDYIYSILSSDRNGYCISRGVLSAAEFGVPQKRMRFVVIGLKKTVTKKATLPNGVFAESEFRTVSDAISDLEEVQSITEVSEDKSGIELPPVPAWISELGRMLRDTASLKNHISTLTTIEALKRFKAIKQGGNFHTLPDSLKTNYSDAKRTQNTIYLRLKYDEPSGTVLNVRKSMWIHPVLHRALSIREAARLQTFPDSFVFCGTKDSQYQQVGNAVPPLLARALADHICAYLDMSEGYG